MVKIIDNCCSLDYLNCLKHEAAASDNWNLFFPTETDFSSGHRLPKLNIIDNGVIKHPILAGLAMGLLLQIHEVAGDLFIPKIYWCGISIKDKHKPDIKHIDYVKDELSAFFKKDENFVKILGIINSDWKEEWGGGFFHDGTSNYIKPTSFCIFDPTKAHAAEAIFTDKKRFAIDFAVFRDKQSLNEARELGYK